VVAGGGEGEGEDETRRDGAGEAAGRGSRGKGMRAARRYVLDWTGTRRRQHTQHRQAERRMEALHSSGRAGRRRLCLGVWRVWVCLCVCVVSVRLSLSVVRPTTACTSALWRVPRCLPSVAAGRGTLDARRSTLDAGRCTAWPVHATSSGPGGTPRLHPWLWLYLIPPPTTWHHRTTQHQAPWAAGRLGPPNRTETPGCPKARGAAVQQRPCLLATQGHHARRIVTSSRPIRHGGRCSGGGHRQAMGNQGARGWTRRPRFRLVIFFAAGISRTPAGPPLRTADRRPRPGPSRAGPVALWSWSRPPCRLASGGAACRAAASSST
jgi:hypothetical protein